MSEQSDSITSTPYLETTLAALADTAAEGAGMQSVGTIRRRGNWRAAWQRAGVGAAAVAVVAAISVTAVSLNDEARQPATRLTPSVSPTATAFPSTMWLPADQFPLAGSYHWKADPPSDTTEETLSFTCQRHEWTTDLGSGKSQGVDLTPNPAKPGNDNFLAVQRLVRFPDAKTAAAAYNTLERDLLGCQAQETKFLHDQHQNSTYTVARTATITSGSAWATSVSKGFNDLPLESHILIVQRGSVITTVVLQWNGGTRPTGYDTAKDQATLDRIAARLATG